MVVFEQFGDSSLNLVLRAFLRDIESRMPTIDELHTRINREFKLAGIEISFPQRDLHIRSIDPKLGMTLGDHTEPAIDNNKVMSEAASSGSLVKED
jgi:potassium efflux system protein